MVGLGLNFINSGLGLDRKIWQPAHSVATARFFS